MTNEAPVVTETATIVIPLDEWNAHKEKVESLVNLLTGVMQGLSGNPMLMAMLPPNVLNSMRG